MSVGTEDSSNDDDDDMVMRHTYATRMRERERRR